MTHPLPFIEELQDLTEIKSLSDVLKVNSFVYSLIVATTDPYNPYTNDDSVEKLYNRFKTGEIGGWCGLNGEYLIRLMREYGISSRGFNYGDLGKDGLKFHLVSIIEIGGVEYLVDPYINKHYCYLNSEPMPFDVLIDKIEKRKTDEILPVYGKGKKKINRFGEWLWVEPEEFDHILSRHAYKLTHKMLLEKYDSDDLYLLMLD